MATEMKALIAKLNPVCKKALEAAASLCVQRTHFNVEISHLLLKLNEQVDTDWQLICRHYDVDKTVVSEEVHKDLTTIKTGCTSSPALSPNIIILLEHAWMISSLKLNQTTIRSGAILLALVDNDQLRGLTMASCPSLVTIPRHNLKDDINELLRHSLENRYSSQPSLTPQTTIQEALAFPEKKSVSNEALNQYTINLTSKARENKLDPICGREREVYQLIDILSRRKQNNPILVGDAGVGKTAIVEGLAQKIVNGEVPVALQNTEILTLDLGLLQAGAGIRGEFEERLKTILSEINAATSPIILFIDEAHTLIGAGGNSGTNDAANLLKPALARGELRTIAATTWPEYKRYIENDAALSRRFELVKVNEPSQETAIVMLRQLVTSLEEHHHALILDEAVQAAVILSKRFLPHRRLPDKAINLLDTACARVSLGRSTTPPVIEELENKKQLLSIEKNMLQREHKQTPQHEQRLKEIDQELAETTQRTEEHKLIWQETKKLMEKIQTLQTQLDEIPSSLPARNNLYNQLLTLEEQTQKLCRTLNFTYLVDRETIAQVLASWTGIPIASMLHHYDGLSADDLFQRLKNRIIGQDHGLEIIANSVVSYNNGLADPSKPQGVFLLVGPSGVGKTETAQVLAEVLTGHVDHLIRINLSEFREPHSVASLKGAPPGYVGFGKGGILTEAVRRNPYSVILLDEIEKSHPDVMTLFYQVFDKGVMEDGEGVEINFRNTLIIMTSNLGSELITKESTTNNINLNNKLQEIYEARFHPAFIARTTIIPYLHLSMEHLIDITHLKLTDLQKRLYQNHKALLDFTKADIERVIELATQTPQGARGIDKIINVKILPVLSMQLMDFKKKNEPFAKLSFPEL